MSRGFREYRDSGVDWLGAVPVHWPAIPLKHLANFVNGAAFKPEDWVGAGTPIIRIENLNGGADFNFYRGEVDRRYVVLQGDILFGWSGNRGTSFGPFIWNQPGRYFLNQHIFNVRGFDGDRTWFYWCLRAVTQHVEQQAHGIIGMVHITKGDLGAIKVPLPPIQEQAAIAAFLDRETGKIDALVEEQRRLIELLKEKRHAVISHAVTKGLDPNARMKPSGIEWLGDVPAHWTVTQVKRACSTITDGAHVSPQTEGGVYPFVSTKDVGAGRIDFDGCLLTSEESYFTLVRSGCQPVLGDVLFSTDGTIGQTVVVKEKRDFVVASSLIIIRPDRSKLDADYLGYQCQSSAVVSQVSSFVKGAGLPRLSIQNLLKVVGVVPPLAEQRNIAAYLDETVSAFDELIDEATKGIALLEERRSAFISAAVTGKIDVREFRAVSEEEAA